MSQFFCPRCDRPGIQADGYAYCVTCRNARQRKTRLQLERNSGKRTPRVVTKDEAEKSAMKGFNALSQEFLTRRLV
jgi:uncharacterized Zn finger protein (UPF0148 family)